MYSITELISQLNNYIHALVLHGDNCIPTPHFPFPCPHTHPVCPYPYSLHMLISPQHRRVFTNKIHRPYFHGITVKSVHIPTLLLWQYHCSHPHATLMQYTYSVTQKKFPLRFSDIFLKWLGIFKSILHTYYTFISTLDYKFLFNYLQFWWSYAILSETTHRFFLHFTRT